LEYLGTILAFILASRSPAVAVAVAVGGIAHIAVAEAGERKNEIGVKDGW